MADIFNLLFKLFYNFSLVSIFLPCQTKEKIHNNLQLPPFFTDFSVNHFSLFVLTNGHADNWQVRSATNNFICILFAWKWSGASKIRFVYVVSYICYYSILPDRRIQSSNRDWLIHLLIGCNRNQKHSHANYQLTAYYLQIIIWSNCLTVNWSCIAWQQVNVHGSEVCAWGCMCICLRITFYGLVNISFFWLHWGNKKTYVNEMGYIYIYIYIYIYHWLPTKHHQKKLN